MPRRDDLSDAAYAAQVALVESLKRSKCGALYDAKRFLLEVNRLGRMGRRRWLQRRIPLPFVRRPQTPEEHLARWVELASKPI